MQSRLHAGEIRFRTGWHRLTASCREPNAEWSPAFERAIVRSARSCPKARQRDRGTPSSAPFYCNDNCELSMPMAFRGECAAQLRPENLCRLVRRFVGRSTSSFW